MTTLSEYITEYVSSGKRYRKMSKITPSSNIDDIIRYLESIGFVEEQNHIQSKRSYRKWSRRLYITLENRFRKNYDYVIVFGEDSDTGHTQIIKSVESGFVEITPEEFMMDIEST
jgi:hypothetical protein